MNLAKLNYRTVVDILYEQVEIPNSDGMFQYIVLKDANPIPTIGMMYLGDDTFVLSGKRISKLQFRNKFTDTEKITIDNYQTNPNLPANIKAVLNTIYKDFDASQYIDLTRTDTQAAVRFFETVGLIAHGRADEILA